MRKSAAFVFSGITAVAVLFLAPPASADRASVCPDGFVLVPAQLVEQGERKDHNSNGFVCGKFEDSKLVGGPDESLTDDILV
jgi:hypothetical protein